MGRRGGDFFFDSFRLIWFATVIGCGVLGYRTTDGSFIGTAIYTAIGVPSGIILGVVGPVVLTILAIAGLLCMIGGILG